jgi:putative peptidoglycan lipid II flippase
MLLLRRGMNDRIGVTGLPASYVAKLWTAAAAGAAAAWAVKLTLPALPPVVTALLIVGPYGVIYLATTFAFRVPEVSAVIARVRRRA